MNPASTPPWADADQADDAERPDPGERSRRASRRCRASRRDGGAGPDGGRNRAQSTHHTDAVHTDVVRPDAARASLAPSRGARVARGIGRVLRRAAISCGVLFLVLTAASVLGNALTTPPDQLDPDAGEYTQVGEVRVHYQRWDPPAGTATQGAPVVLLPGFAESSVAFRNAGPLLAAHGRTVYALDLPGFGYTRGGDTTDLRSQADLVAGTIAELEIDRPVVVGHSLGAAVAGGTALWHPERVRGVVFADGDAQDLNFGDGTWRAWIARLPYTTSAYRTFTRWTWLNRLALAESCGSACTAFDGEAGERLAEAWMWPLQQGDVERSLLDSAGRDGILHLEESQMRAIAVPRGIIWGAEDTRSGGSLQDTRDRLGHPPERIIDGAAHNVMNARPQEFADAVDGLARQLGAAGTDGGTR